MNRLLIYIGDLLLDLYDKSLLAITYQIVDIRDLKIRNVGFSSTIDLPPTENNLVTLGNPQNVKSGSSIPYTQQTAKCISNGIEYFTGRFEISEVGKTIKAAIYENIIDVFDSVRNRKLYELGALDNSEWNASDIDGFRLSAINDGIVAPVINWGQFDESTPSINSDLYLPSYFYKRILDFILSATGYTFVGDVLTNNTDLDDLIIPFSQDEFKYNQEYSDERNFKATTTPLTQTIPAPSGTSATKVTIINTLVSQGAQDWYEEVDSRYQIPGFPSTGSIGKIKLFCAFDITGNVAVEDTPNMRMQVQIRKNGVTVVEASQNRIIELGINNHTGEFGGTDEGVDFEGADYFEVFIGWQEGAGTITSIVVNSITFFGYVTTEANRNYLFHNYLLPDIDQIKILEDFIIRFGVTITLEDDGNTVTMKTIEGIIKNKAASFDWTDKRDIQPDLIAYDYEDYAQSNLFKYTTADNIPEALGQGILSVNNENLELESDYYTSEFENCETAVPGEVNLNMALIPVYDNTSVTIEDFIAQPGLKLLTLRDKTAGEPAITFDATPRNDYRVAYFVDSNQVKDTGFQYFIDNYYASLSIAFDKTKLITRYYKLDVTDVLSDVYIIFDSGNYFIVNKIDKFIPGKISKVELLRVF